jgi:hypothetical protein
MAGTGPGGSYTMADIGYYDPILLAQLNGATAEQSRTDAQSLQYLAAPYTPPPITPPPGGPSASGPGYGTAFTGMPLGTASLMTLNPLTSPGAPTVPTGTLGGTLGGIGSAACQLLTDSAARAACVAIASGLGGLFGGGTGTSPFNPAQTCPKGYHPDASKVGGCAIDGLGTYLPGDVGKPDYVWTPINGRYGAGVTPVLVQRNQRGCPTGMKLGKDGICYEHLARTERKWVPAHKPLLTGGDMNALRKVHRLEKRWAKAAPSFHKKVVAQGARLMKRPKGK